MMEHTDGSTKQVIAVGRVADYSWVTSECELLPFLQLCPDVIQDRYVAVTSIDSGILSIDEVAEGQGWQSRGHIAYSSKLRSVQDLVLKNPSRFEVHFIEMYTFESPADMGTLKRDPKLFIEPLRRGEIIAFVNYHEFILHDSSRAELVEQFWKQLEWINPESYIADGDRNLTFVCRNTRLFNSVLEKLQSL